MRPSATRAEPKAVAPITLRSKPEERRVAQSTGEARSASRLAGRIGRGWANEDGGRRMKIRGLANEDRGRRVTAGVGE